MDKEFYWRTVTPILFKKALTQNSWVASRLSAGGGCGSSAGNPSNPTPTLRRGASLESEPRSARGAPPPVTRGTSRLGRFSDEPHHARYATTRRRYIIALKSMSSSPTPSCRSMFIAWAR